MKLTMVTDECGSMFFINMERVVWAQVSENWAYFTFEGEETLLSFRVKDEELLRLLEILTGV